MSGKDIAKKVKAGLAKAGAATGDGTSEIYLNRKTYTAGNPINPPTETVTPILLIDAIVKSFKSTLIDGELIRSGDKMVIINGDVEVNQNDEVDINGVKHIVLPVDSNNPSNVQLSYTLHVRSQ